MIATGSLHRGFTGAIGDLIFRNYNGKTVVSIRPVYKNETNTEARRKARARFRDATQSASNAMDDPKQKAYYKQKAKQLKLPNAYTAALTDYLRKAKVGAAKPASFAAKKGNVIHIRVTKGVFKINRITAKLYNREGKILSEQQLTLSPGNKTFHFRFTDNFPDYGGFKIITDEPNKTEYNIRAQDFIN